MTKYLKQTTTGDIYPWTPQLAERDDMETFPKSDEVATLDAPPVDALEVPQEEEVIALQPDDEPTAETAQDPVETQPETENTSQNSDNASADLSVDPELEGAVAAFRRQVTKSSRKTEQPSGDA